MINRKKILHYGLQRSGTNFLETLLKKKFKVKLLFSNKIRSSPIHKHFRLYDDKLLVPEPNYKNNSYFYSYNDFEKVLPIIPDKIVIISKDPYSWYLSYRSWAKKCEWPVASHHYIEEYNSFYSKWLSFKRETNKIIFVKYFDLLQSHDKTVNDLQNQLELTEKWQLPFMSAKLKKVSQSKKFTDKRKKYYLDKEYLNEYKTDELYIINDKLDCRVVKELGYLVES